MAFFPVASLAIILQTLLSLRVEELRSVFLKFSRSTFPSSNVPITYMSKIDEMKYWPNYFVMNSFPPAESERQSRASRSTTINADDIKSSHSQSRQKLSQWISLASKLLEHSMHTIVNRTSPSYGHHLVRNPF